MPQGLQDCYVIRLPWSLRRYKKASVVASLDCRILMCSFSVGVKVYSYQYLIYADVNLVGERLLTINKTTEGLLVSSNEIGLK